MTVRQVFESLLTEVSKVGAPSMLLQDFNYFINKAINQYINKRYNIYDINQQTTDDLRVLKATAMLDPMITTLYNVGLKYTAGSSKLFGATYEVILPKDYLHMLNCICVYKLNKNHKCYNKNDYVQFAAKRLTADAWSVIINDYYNRPLPERPYYYIHNVNVQSDLPTGKTDMFYEYLVKSNGKNNVDPNNGFINDKNGINPGEEGYETTYAEAISNFPRVITLKKKNSNGETEEREISTIEREIAQRYGNPSEVRCEIRYGKDNSVFVLEKVLIDYIKAPLTIRLTQEQVDLTEDTSQIMEFPDYVCQEIINELVHLVMENVADPRLLTHIPVTQSIANPAQQLIQQPRS